jgi:Zn-dependent protease with chaperone function
MRKLVKILLTTFISGIVLTNVGYFGNLAVKADTTVGSTASNALSGITILGLILLIVSVIVFFWMLFKPVK